MKKSDEIIRFIIEVILGNILKLIFAFAMLSVLLYFTLFLGPLLGAAISMMFIPIFGDGPYIEFIMIISSIGMFLYFAYETIKTVWSDEIEAYQLKKEHQREKNFRDSFKDIVTQMKKDVKDRGLENDPKAQEFLRNMDDFVNYDVDKETKLSILRRDLMYAKQMYNPYNPATEELIKAIEQEIKDIENKTVK